MSIRFEHVTRRFPSKTVLNDVSFEVATGEILFVLGKSGMGKSVLLKHIVGLLEPSAGAIWVDGENVVTLDAEGIARVRRKCGLVLQHPALFDSLTVFENIAFGLRRLALSETEMRQIAAEKLALVHLSADLLGRLPTELSYGMQKRVSLARTLAPGPSYLLFDEPTTGLDPITTNAVNQLISELSRKLQVTSIVVSHDMPCALKIADRILVLDQARILALGTREEIRRSKEPLICEFLEEALSLEEGAAL